MPTERVPRITFGVDKLDRLFASWASAIQRALTISVAAPLNIRTDQTGCQLWITLPQRTWAQLTASGNDGSYSWTEVTDDGSGGWTSMPGGRSGTSSSDPVWEANLNPDLDLPVYVEIERSRSKGEWRTVYGTC